MKCLFDNGLPKRLAKTLAYLEGEDGITVIHLSEKFPQNTPDITWITQLSDEKDWFVITKDNQIKKRTHERRAWQESNVPIVFLQKSWMNFDFWNITWRMIRFWPKIKESISKLKNNESIILTVNGNISLISG
jgi:predicted nuclease of predicted toxin-antitoxin system